MPFCNTDPHSINTFSHITANAVKDVHIYLNKIAKMWKIFMEIDMIR